MNTDVKKNRIHRISILSMLFLGLSSCFPVVSKRTNYIIAGEFSGVDSYDERISCSLSITSITKEQFEAANGVNVIEDLVKKVYFKLEFSYTLLEKTETIDFLNFADAYKGATDIPVSYLDENGIWFTPHTVLNSEESENPYYSIHTGKRYSIELFVYLFNKE